MVPEGPIEKFLLAGPSDIYLPKQPVSSYPQIVFLKRTIRKCLTRKKFSPLFPTKATGGSKEEMMKADINEHHKYQTYAQNENGIFFCSLLQQRKTLGDED